MDILIEPDCYKVCRICMESCEDDFVCVHDEFEDNILSEVIAECARVEIRKNDALPRNACRNCAEYMIIAYHIIQKCRESDVTLRSIFKHELDLKHCERTERQYECTKVEDMNPSEYEFLLSDAYEEMILDGGTDGMLKDVHRGAYGATKVVEELVDVGQQLGDPAPPVDEPNEFDWASVQTPPSSYVTTEGSAMVEQKKCCGCRKLFDDEATLTEHCQSVHWPNAENDTDSSKPIRCPMCYKRFSTQHMLKEHQRIVNRKYICQQCGKRFMTQINLDIHMKYHKDKEMHKCCGCRKDFETELDLLVHSQEMHSRDRTADSSRPFECDICFRRYPTRKSLITHKRLIRQFQCDRCGDIFMKKLFLTLHHERMHQKHRCCGCRQEFSDELALAQHSETVHKPDRLPMDDMKPFECDICYKRVASKFCLHQHKKKVYRDKCYACATCGRTFVRANDLSNHETTHSTEMPFECHICARRFKNKHYLKNHLKRHANSSKDHACHECGKCFRTKDLLKTHLISHSQERKFACTSCPATFKRLQCLKIHTRVHTREKAYACPVCQKRYVQSSDLKRHMLTHNPGDEGKPFQCEYCLRRYPRKDYLKVHIRKQHLEKPELLPYDCIDMAMTGAATEMEGFLVC